MWSVNRPYVEFKQHDISRRVDLSTFDILVLMMFIVDFLFLEFECFGCFDFILAVDKSTLRVFILTKHIFYLCCMIK